MSVLPPESRHRQAAQPCPFRAKERKSPYTAGARITGSCRGNPIGFPADSTFPQPPAERSKPGPRTKLDHEDMNKTTAFADTCGFADLAAATELKITYSARV